MKSMLSSVETVVSFCCLVLIAPRKQTLFMLIEMRADILTYVFLRRVQSSVTNWSACSIERVRGGKGW